MVVTAQATASTVDALRALRAVGHRIALLQVGDREPPLRLPGVATTPVSSLEALS